MIYKLDRTCYHDYRVVEKNRLPHRGYFIPYPTMAQAESVSLLRERYESAMVKNLSGEWDFAYFQNMTQIPEPMDTDSIVFDKLPVPSCWQLYGYEKPVYLNHNYMFDCDPPHIPHDNELGGRQVGAYEFEPIEGMYNSVGVYRTYIHADDLSGRKILAFLGATSGLQVYLNGDFVGYSEGAHNTAEFDVTDKLQKGENELVVLVHKWSNGSYLEAQDMFRHVGIFRDVLLYDLPEDHLWDFYARPMGEKGVYDLTVDMTAAVKTADTIELILKDGAQVFATQSVTVAENLSVTMKQLKVEEWSAETPKNYTLFIRMLSDGKELCCVRQLIGFCNVRIDGNRFLFNGKCIKLKGVNHHDSDPETGFYMAPEKFERDIKLMKELNINCVRTSHYPPDALFVQLAMVYGIYVLLEGDIEEHGCLYARNDRNVVANDPRFMPHHVDRIDAAWSRDKNNRCIIMWSLGNEAGGWKNFDACYDHLKARTDIPIFYENVLHTPRRSYDVLSSMYPSIEWLNVLADPEYADRLLIEEDQKKPYFACEYAHAMGLAPGDLEEYWRVFYKHDSLMGGCIWEWCDHAVYHADGPYEYTYGGDHGEVKHDSNFCVDGMVFPNRELKAGSYEVQQVYRPIRLVSANAESFTLWNTNSFADSSALDITAVLYQNGEEIWHKSIDKIIAAGESVTFPLEREVPDGNVWLNITYKRDGKQIAQDQKVYAHQLPDIAAKEGARLVGNTVLFTDGSLTFDRESGEILQYTVNGKDMLQAVPTNRHQAATYCNIFRAPLDNDRKIKSGWKKLGYYTYNIKSKLLSLTAEGGKVTLQTESVLTNEDLRMATVWKTTQVCGDGTIFEEVSIKAGDTELKELPRFGMTWELVGDLRTVSYIGRGTHDNLVDMRQSTPIGYYTECVDQMSERNIKPQEGGMRDCTTLASFTNEKGEGIEFLAQDRPFSLSAKPYTSETLAEWTHRDEITEGPSVLCGIDCYMRPTGNESCGPKPLLADTLFNRGGDLPKGVILTLRYAVRPKK